MNREQTERDEMASAQPENMRESKAVTQDQIPQTHLSRTDAGYTVIHNGMPILPSDSTLDECRKACAQFKLAFPSQVWIGTLGRFGTVAECQYANTKTASAGQNTRVKDLGEQFQLVTDSQDIIATLDSIGQGQEFCEVGCLFVEVLDGEYGQVYYCEQSVPRLADRVYKLQ